MPGNPTLSTFAGVAPPWSLSNLDTNFTNVATLLKNFNNYSVYIADTGAADAYVTALPAGTTATLAAGLVVWFKASNTNTGASTINVGGTGVTSIKTLKGGALAAGQIQSGGVHGVLFDGTNFILLNTFTSQVSTGYASAAQTISNAGLLTLAHSLGAEPSVVAFIAQCTTGERNYSIGDRILVAPVSFYDGAAAVDRGFTVKIDATNIKIRFCDSANPLYAVDATTGGFAALTSADWQLYVKAWLIS